MIPAGGYACLLIKRKSDEGFLCNQILPDIPFTS